MRGVWKLRRSKFVRQKTISKPFSITVKNYWPEKICKLIELQSFGLQSVWRTKDIFSPRHLFLCDKPTCRVQLQFRKLTKVKQIEQMNKIVKHKF